MKNVTILTCLLLLLSTLTTTAQEDSKFPLKVGSKMPDILFNSMVNYLGKKAKLSDFVGKPVILDLWHVTCSACIQGMPKMQDLQTKFGNKIQIIAVTFNSKSEYENLKERSSFVKSITSLPFAFGVDIKKIFDAASYPTHVWIDGTGTVRAITEPGNATEANILALINNNELDFIMEKPGSALDRYFPNDVSLLSHNTGSSLNILKYYSIFTGRIDYNQDGPGAQHLCVGPDNPGIKRINVSLIDLINSYMIKNPEKHPKYVFESDDLKKYLMPNPMSEAYNQWRQQYNYCYELSLPSGIIYTKEYIKECVKQDMQRFFNIKVEQKRQLSNCLILYRIDSIDRIKSKSKITNVLKHFDDGMNQGSYILDMPISFVSKRIEGILSFGKVPVKVIDETNYKDNVDLKFDTSIKDLNLLEAGLKKYGLGLKEEQREVDCIVISKAN